MMAMRQRSRRPGIAATAVAKPLFPLEQALPFLEEGQALCRLQEVEELGIDRHRLDRGPELAGELCRRRLALDVLADREQRRLLGDHLLAGLREHEIEEHLGGVRTLRV